jgi:F0F1-type ATP synthase membrane subunit c/vacuolar-type H+-ATPase subunit K
MEGLWLVWAGLAIGLVGLGVGIGEWMTASQSIKTMAQRPTKMNKTLVMTILFIALVESAAIYWLIVALQTAG